MITAAATAAMLAGVAAPAAFAQQMEDPDVTMVTGKVFRALRACDIDGNMIDTLTMAQVAGITITASSDDGSNKCQKIEAIARGDG
ncbi:hypothetical protein OCGS_1796 [Oceaniovalibus guishaninsula JLT2003]|uniref:Uncharacterized protein n=2 Tax=Oceaniovalibus TaxID=1207070 RepID=K2I5Q3_9RHOB|nr:hypothetical protein OCGS_1796 [Oceaniovalibus guishaninsula JLT2003]